MSDEINNPQPANNAEDVDRGNDVDDVDQAEQADDTSSPPHATKTQILLYFGIAGFFFGVLLLFNPKSNYHDIYFRPKEIVRTLLTQTIQKYFPTEPNHDTLLIAEKALKRIRYDDNLLDLPRPRYHVKLDSPIYAERRKLDSLQFYLRLKQELHRVEFTGDTSFNGRFFVGSLFTDKDALAGIYVPDSTPVPTSFHFIYNRDTADPDHCVHVEGDITLKSNSYPASGLSFFIKYPDFGTFSLLTIFQIVAFFIVIPLAIMTVVEISKEWKATGIHKNTSFYDRAMVKAFTISFVIVIAFAAIVYIFIFTPAYIGDQFFRNDLTAIVWVYFVMAYLSAVACYTGYLFTGRIIADMMVKFKTKAVKLRSNLVQQKARALVNAAAPPQIALSPADTALGDRIATTGNVMADMSDRYKRLRSHFTFFFYTSAFLLSMTVVGSGSLFSAIDSLNLVQFLNAPPSHPILRNDFVYLLGGLYSILLLLFYLPVKINMVNLETQIPDLKSAGSDDNTWLPVFSSGLRTTASVLAASSPFLISIIQYILQSIGGGK